MMSGEEIDAPKMSLSPGKPSEAQLRRAEIVERMYEISGPTLAKDAVSTVPKTFVHWDYVMQEMGWLAADFQKERQRHQANGKKVSKAVDQYHKTKETKKLQKVKDEIVKQKRLSSKISREVRKFWLKINKVIAFKQKGEADEVRQKAMDKHLVFLVKQTERYTSLLTENLKSGGEMGLIIGEKDKVRSRKRRGSGASSSSGSPRRSSSSSKRMRIDETTAEAGSDEDEDEDDQFDDDDDSRSVATSATGTTGASSHQRRRSIRTNERSDMHSVDNSVGGSTTSAGGIRLGPSSRSVAKRGSGGGGGSVGTGDDDVDYLSESLKDDLETLAGDEDDDGEFECENVDEPDDETTLIEEEQRGGDGISSDAEIAMLQTEGELPIEQLRALYANMPAYDDDDEEDEDDDEDEDDEEEEDDVEEVVKSESEQKVVTFVDVVAASSSSSNSSSSSSSSSSAAAADNVDVEMADDDDEDDDDDDGEFECENVDEPDDETTLIEEEQRGGDGISSDAEIAMLQTEGELPIEQLRALYANMPAYDDDDEDDEEEEEEDDDEEDEGAAMEVADEEDDDAMDVVSSAEGGSSSSSRRHRQKDNQSSSSSSSSSSSARGEPSTTRTTTDPTSASASASTGDNALKRLEKADEAARSVCVERPFVLSNKLVLREYQHVGLNW